jgi:hypothetical protein
MVEKLEGACLEQDFVLLPAGEKLAMSKPRRVSLSWAWNIAQGRLRVEPMKPLQCPSETTQTLGSMQHLFTLQMHTYKVQEGAMDTVGHFIGHCGR